MLTAGCAKRVDNVGSRYGNNTVLGNDSSLGRQLNASLCTRAAALRLSPQCSQRDHPRTNRRARIPSASGTRTPHCQSVPSLRRRRPSEPRSWTAVSRRSQREGQRSDFGNLLSIIRCRRRSAVVSFQCAGQPVHRNGELHVEAINPPAIVHLDLDVAHLRNVHSRNLFSSASDKALAHTLKPQYAAVEPAANVKTRHGADELGDQKKGRHQRGGCLREVSTGIGPSSARAVSLTDGCGEAGPSPCWT